MNVIEALEKARDIVNNGWCQGDYGDGHGNYCAIGALAEATHWGNRDMNRSAYHDGKEALLALVPLPFGSVALYNDAPDTTKQDILDLYDAAIVKAS